jgi:glycosyltransferase involved in cell wall biosynthesis
MNKKLSIITLTYNNLNETTIPFIKSLYEYTDTKLFELILVDNGSSDVHLNI